MADTIPAQRTRPMIPIRVTEVLRNLRSGKEETWAAESTDHVWAFQRTEEPGTPWWAVHRSTGLEATFGTLSDARRSAAGDLLGVLCWNQRAELRRNGELLAAPSTLIRARCECGGWLGLGDLGRRLQHIDGCNNCAHPYTHYGLRGDKPAPSIAESRCFAVELHVVCREVRPVLCFRCERGNGGVAECEGPCREIGCCGCCAGDDDDHYGED